ncbi:MAG: malectin domain-containing carbohydrate-binding protein, partial [Armatimonadota bacterium]
PGTSVLRLWVELESVSGEPVGPSHIPFSLRLIDAAPLTQYWMIGGNSAEDQGMMKSASIGAPYHQEIAGWSTCAFMPWMAFQRSSPSGDGWFLALEYLVNWRMVVERGASGPVTVSSAIPDLAAVRIKPGERIALPTVTIGAFSGDLDDMAARVYDWQYEYLWNYTNMDFYARPKWAVPWTFCAQNLQEQFGERLAYLDMDADLARAVGFEMLWDDAGWSAFPGWPDDNYHTVFDSTYEGPDFSQTLRYLRKSGMNWLAWFTKRPPSGVMDTKVGSWGNFEWRSDAVELPDWASDGDLRNKVRHFLDSHPRCSFHTCSLGSSYSHTFEIQRYADTNYFADGGRGPQTNYYFSYVEPPDKWTDIIEPWSTKGKYDPDKARQVLTMVPFWGLHATPEDQEAIRRDLEIYRYLLQEGVAGRWSYTCHPEVTGDREFYYSQRTSRDRTKACIILKHMAPGPVTIFPRGLLSEHRYVVGLDSTRGTMIRTGADLMAHGIAIREQAPGELIYLGLPRRPRSGMDTTTPTAPGRVLARRETNLGHSGVAIYWSPGSDDTWVSYYEVRRGEAILGKVSTGTYFFDHSPGWDPSARYAVRTVDGDGNASEWSGATAIAHEPTTYHALGGLFSEQGREGWRAETTADSHTYTPMAWIRPPKTSSADEGGTPNQPGGIEGLWGGPGGAHIGRAWQQASSEVACVRTWVAPKAGTVRIVSRVMKEWYRQDKGQPLRVRILHGGRQIWPKSGWATVPLCDLAGLQHDLTADVAAGDAIRFVLDTGADPDNDIIAWMPRIIYTDAEPATEQLSVVRILCGSKQAYTDHAGNVWSADRFFSGGRPTATDAAIVETLPTLQDQPLYQHGRQGREFSYAISVSPGIYTVRLKLAEPKYQWLSSRPMDLEINGQQVLRDFDICQDARGRRRADDRVFRYVVPDAAGNIVLRFTGGWDPLQRTDQALAQAIEVLPEIRPTVRINCGSDTDFIDWNSDIWRADTATDGTVLRSAAPLTQASPTLYDQALYQAARSGRRLIYSISLPRGLYAVHLKFAELWLTELGQRPMNIEINGRRFWESWDPATTAGQVGMAADTRAEGITPDADGRITIRITATGARNAIVQGIEIE